MPSDLHMHTTFSDGRLTPEELVAAAKTAGLSYMAITDHDTVEGISYLYENGLYPCKGIHIIRELSSVHTIRRPKSISLVIMWIFIIVICWISSMM